MKYFLIASGLFVVGLPWHAFTDYLSTEMGFSDIAMASCAGVSSVPGWLLLLWGAFIVYLPGLLLAALLCWFIGRLNKCYMICTLAFLVGTQGHRIASYVDHWWTSGYFLNLFDDFFIYPLYMSIFCILSAWLSHRDKIRKSIKEQQRAFPVQSM